MRSCSWLSQIQNVIASQVNTDGVISLGNPIASYSSNPLPLTDTQQIIAPYWANVDTRGTGKIFYRQTTNPSLLDKTSNTIRGVFLCLRMLK